MFGANETARATVIGGLQRQELSLSIRKPQFLLRSNVLFGSLIVRHEGDEAFEERVVCLLVGVERKWNKRLTLSGGLSAEVSQIDEDLDGDFDAAQLLGAPLTARYDASNSLLDPSRGYRLGTSVTPYVGAYLNKTLMFVSTDITGSVYLSLDIARRYVFAHALGPAPYSGQSTAPCRRPSDCISAVAGQFAAMSHTLSGHSMCVVIRSVAAQCLKPAWRCGFVLAIALASCRSSTPAR